MPIVLKRILQVIGCILLVLILVVGGYVCYLMLTYNRIADNTTVEVKNNSSEILQAGTPYKAAIYNIGFGAYTPDYTFFMDEGIMADGTHTWGEHGTAVSKESVIACTEGAIKTLAAYDPDFVMMQEVDTDSTRSFGVNQQEMVNAAFSDGFGHAFAVNFHSGFLAYPFAEMHGIVNAGLLTDSRYQVESAVRRSYPIDESFPWKFFDLDRCFLVERLPVSNGKQLVLINNHMSAYDEGGVIRAKQLDLLCGILEQEAAAGNYVIVGGDWNHALCNSAELYKSEQLVPPWVALFDESLLPAGFSVVEPTNLKDVPSCRGDDIPYTKGVTYTVTVDGFVVSDNVKAEVLTIDTGFEYSDHNPVLLTFELV